MTAEKIKISKQKRTKKKALPKPKDLKNKKQKNNPYGEEWREDPIVLEAHGIYFGL